MDVEKRGSGRELLQVGTRKVDWQSYGDVLCFSATKYTKKKNVPLCSIHSWNWPSRCPASPLSFWQPRRLWGVTAKPLSLSLKSPLADASDTWTPSPTVYKWRPKCLFTSASVFSCIMPYSLTCVPSEAAHSHSNCSKVSKIVHTTTPWKRCVSRPLVVKTQIAGMKKACPLSEPKVAVREQNWFLAYTSIDNLAKATF